MTYRGRNAPDRRIFTLVGQSGREVVCVQILHLWPAAGLADVQIVPDGPLPREGVASRSIAAVWRVSGQPLCHEYVGRRLARGVAGDSGEELLPAKGEST